MLSGLLPLFKNSTSFHKKYQLHKRAIKDLGKFPLLNGTIFSALFIEIRPSVIILLIQAEKPLWKWGVESLALLQMVCLHG